MVKHLTSAATSFPVAFPIPLRLPTFSSPHSYLRSSRSPRPNSYGGSSWAPIMRPAPVHSLANRHISDKIPYLVPSALPPTTCTSLPICPLGPRPLDNHNRAVTPKRCIPLFLPDVSWSGFETTCATYCILPYCVV